MGEVKNMTYTVDPEVFALNEHLVFGIIIGRDLVNGPSRQEDLSRLRRAEDHIRTRIPLEQIKEYPMIASYRDVMGAAGINPNKYPLSVEAMVKRVLKGGSLPSINALVDLCNAVSLEQVISLGAHDLDDIHEDLSVRFSTGEETFLPIGQSDTESVDPGELIFTSGNTVQTRRWIWRQSELGKCKEESRTLIFQIVGFDTALGSPLILAMEEIRHLIGERFSGSSESFTVTSDTPKASWSLGEA